MLQAPFFTFGGSKAKQVILGASFDAMDASSLMLGTSRKSGIQGSFCISSSYSSNGTRTSSTSMASRRTSEGLGVRSSNLCRKRNSAAVAPKCSSDGTEQWWGVEKKEVTAEQKGKAKESLKAGSAVVVTEAPPMLKTAEPMPMMRANNGVINVGDAGRWVVTLFLSFSLFASFVMFLLAGSFECCDRIQEIYHNLLSAKGQVKSLILSVYSITISPPRDCPSTFSD